jgi:hypothetical protein
VEREESDLRMLGISRVDSDIVMGDLEDLDTIRLRTAMKKIQSWWTGWGMA